MNRGKLEILKQEMECLNIVIPGDCRLKWIVIRRFPGRKLGCVYRRNKVALKLRKDFAQATGGYNTKSD